MKWTEDQIKGLKQLCMKGVSNKELAAHFQVPITEIHAKRSALGITIPKVKAMQGGKAPSGTRTPEAIKAEIVKVEKAKEQAYKKLQRAEDRLTELYRELGEAK